MSGLCRVCLIVHPVFIAAMQRHVEKKNIQWERERHEKKRRRGKGDKKGLTGTQKF